MIEVVYLLLKQMGGWSAQPNQLPIKYEEWLLNIEMFEMSYGILQYNMYVKYVRRHQILKVM